MADETKTPDPQDSEVETPFSDADVDARDLEIAMLKDEVVALKDRLLRTAADMDNLRKRAEREKAEATLYAATNFARDLLSVSDNMQRALAAMSQEAKDGADAVTRNLMTGVEMTEKELLNVFQRYGIRKVDTVGHKFDPNLHQALFEVPTKDHPPGTVVQEMQSGFAIGDRCLRPAMVGVAKAEG
jgi:molecular chaperone GrpE